ncbi:MAG: AraC family transcriptional regulator [Gammaproteobacteria bacterium]|nr:AraC family transcriptional regulator [Gammaproteobacteria bacterium]
MYEETWNRLYICRHLGVHVSNSVFTKQPYPYISKIVISLDHSIRAKHPASQNWEESDAFLFNIEKAVEIQPSGKMISIFFVADGSELPLKTLRIGDSNSDAFFAFRLNSAAKTQLNELLHGVPDKTFLQNLFFEVITSIKTQEGASIYSMDERITKIIEFINTNLESPLRLNDIATAVNLSPSRIMALFSGEIGMPIRRYILWSRVIKAVDIACGQTNLTEAAHLAGFTDLPHFSNAFKAVFGFPPSTVFQRGEIELVICR